MNVFDEDCGRDALSEATRLGVRTPAGERVLEPGEVVFFPAGPDGAHQLFNAGNESRPGT